MPTGFQSFSALILGAFFQLMLQFQKTPGHIIKLERLGVFQIGLHGIVKTLVEIGRNVFPSHNGTNDAASRGSRAVVVHAHSNQLGQDLAWIRYTNFKAKADKPDIIVDM